MTGDQDDIISRLDSYLPRDWFGDLTEAPIVGGVIAGIAAVFAVTYTLIQFFMAQARLQTSTGGWIDLWAADFFGGNLPRKANESDASYIARIQFTIFQQKATRPAMIRVLTQLTGFAPIIFEPNRPLDSGCLGVNSGPNSFCGVARMGSLATPYSALITAFRPQITGGSAGAAYCNAITISAMSTPVSQSYTGSLAAEVSSASDDDIIAAIVATKPLATYIGVAITNN